MNNVIYRHYGNDNFHKFVKTENDPNSITNKPSYGLWASRRDHDKSYFSWDDFARNMCLAEGNDENKFNLEKFFDFKLDENSKILVIDDPDKLVSDEPLIIEKKIFNVIKTRCLNMEYIQTNYDGIELIHGGYYNVFHDAKYLPTKEYQKIFPDKDVSKWEPIYGLFYNWDVDSIVVWNDDIIIPI